ncbi:SRPBCC family protein [bacterium]|nr:SRPBCC family protein [bacterium]
MSLDAAQEVAVEIAASQAECFAAILDFERYPEWSSAVTQARILERDRAGVGRIVEFHIDAKIKTLRYVLEYQHKKPTQLTWHSIDGDIESIEGIYRFKKLAPTRTEASCRQEIRLGFWLPGPLRRLAERTALAQSVNEFKAHVERAADPAPRSRSGRRAS